jgi:hypothetical protein
MTNRFHVPSPFPISKILERDSGNRTHHDSLGRKAKIAESAKLTPQASHLLFAMSLVLQTRRGTSPYTPQNAGIIGDVPCPYLNCPVLVKTFPVCKI